MIVFITCRRHGRTFRSLTTGTFGVATPRVRTTNYERLFRSWWIARATYVFADLERLSPWELAIAADLFATMRAAGLRCLNDPARAMSRVELLTTLQDSGLNPIYVARADSNPKPPRYPVFLRSENDHRRARPDLYYNQQELVTALAGLRSSGTPLRGLLVTECVAEPYAEALWVKWGTYRIGDRIIVEHIAVDDTWLVKFGDHAKVTDAIALDEHDAVATNRFAADLMPIFEAGGIDFGRADHAMVGGHTVVYEINTNPWVGRFVPDQRPLRHKTQLIARQNIADALAEIDTPPGGPVRIPGGEIRRPLNWWGFGFRPRKRP